MESKDKCISYLEDIKYNAIEALEHLQGGYNKDEFSCCLSIIAQQLEQLEKEIDTVNFED